MLRQDEVANDDFMCKVCLKSRANSNTRDARSSFFDNQMSVSLIEAKKNFLVNIEQIDLRERAEFEILDEFGDTKVNTDSPSVETDVLNDFVSLTNSPPEENNRENEDTTNNNIVTKTEDNSNLNQAEEQDSLQSDLSESDPNYSSSRSDTNYTDDEHSESDDLVERDKDDDDFASLMVMHC